MSDLEILANNINKKSGSNKKLNDRLNQCIAVKRVITKGNALYIINSGKECWISKEKHNDVFKEFIYTRCLKSCNEGINYCNSHKNNTFKTFEFIKTCENSRLASHKDFEDIRTLNSISIVLKNKKSVAYFELKKYAEKLLLENKHNINYIDIKHKSNKKSNSITSIINLSDKREIVIENKSINNTLEHEELINDIKEEDEEGEDNDKEDKSSDDESSDESCKEESSDEEEFEEYDENDFVKVESNNDKTYYIQNNDAYGENDDETYSKVGVFTEVKKKYHTILYEDKFYTIFFNHQHSVKGDIRICIVSNKIYDKKMNIIGQAINKDSNSTDYELIFSDKI
jgi:hypothetical protein